MKYSKALKSGNPVIPYIMVGQKSLENSFEALEFYLNMGCRIVEIGVPFSDPSADGPIIQMASKEAIANGSCLKTVLAFTQEAKHKYPHAILLIMTYFNPIVKMGFQEFIAHCYADGVIIPDLPLEEQNDFGNLLKTKSIDLIQLISLQTSTSRLQRIIAKASGFLYVMAIQGITGNKQSTPKSSEKLIMSIRTYTDLPIVAGFGIQTKEQVTEFTKSFDGVVIASELLRLYQAGNFSGLKALLG